MYRIKKKNYQKKNKIQIIYIYDKNGHSILQKTKIPKYG